MPARFDRSVYIIYRLLVDLNMETKDILQHLNKVTPTPKPSTLQNYRPLGDELSFLMAIKDTIGRFTAPQTNATLDPSQAPALVSTSPVLPMPVATTPMLPAPVAVTPAASQSLLVDVTPIIPALVAVTPPAPRSPLVAVTPPAPTSMATTASVLTPPIARIRQRFARELPPVMLVPSTVTPTAKQTRTQLAAVRSLKNDEQQFYGKGTSNPLAVVIHVQHHYNAKLDREGSDQDAANVVAFFESIHWQTGVNHNPRAVEIMAIIDRHCTDKTNKDREAVAFIMLGHGMAKNTFLGSNGKVDIMTIRRKIAKSLVLANKPLMMVVNACRGDLFHPWHRISDSGIVKKVFGRKPGKKVAKNAKSPPSIKVKIVPQGADLVIAYGTQEGSFGFRHEIKGSYFMHSFLETFAANCYSADVLSLFTMTMDHLSKVPIDTWDKPNKRMGPVVYQQGEVKTTLRKKWMLPFTPLLPIVASE